MNLPPESTQLAAPRTETAWSRIKKALGPVAVAGALVAKFFAKLKFLVLPLLKFLPILLKSGGTMLLMIWIYTRIWGWQFGVGFVLLLFVHEMGHVIQLRREGVPASAPLFIPFLGAVVGMKRMPDNALAEARVGLAGPVLGTLGSAALIPVYLATGNNLFRALAFFGFFLHLFNLAPVLPLDGGRAMAAMAPWMWAVGFVGMIAAAVFFPNPIIILILLFGAMETWRRWKARRSNDPEQQRYYRVKPVHRLAVAAVYIGLIVVCAIGMDATHLERAIPN
jgi:Zn-dependent protease